MSQCVPSWHREEAFNPKNDVFKLDYEVAELTWENGQLAMHELGTRRVINKSQPSNSWDKPRAPETLEVIVNQATHQPYNKPQLLTINDNNLVPWLNMLPHPKPTVMTSDGLVPSALDAGCSTRVDSCSADHPSVFVAPRVTPDVEHDWNSSKNISVSESESGSGRDGSKSTLPDDSAYHCITQREANAVKEKKRGKAKSSISNKRKRTAAIHNQSERKRRDKINQKMNTLQKLVPNSSKTDKASMLDEVIEYVKQLQALLHMVNRMNISPMMMLPLVMQQQMQLSMMNSMGIGMGMGMGGMDMNTNIGLSNMPAFLPSPNFMRMPSWNSFCPTDRAVNNTNTMTADDPMSAFLAVCQSSQQPVKMDSYSRMVALYHQQMQTQLPGPFQKN